MLEMSVDLDSLSEHRKDTMAPTALTPQIAASHSDSARVHEIEQYREVVSVGSPYESVRQRAYEAFNFANRHFWPVYWFARKRRKAHASGAHHAG